MRRLVIARSVSSGKCGGVFGFTHPIFAKMSSEEKKSVIIEVIVISIIIILAVPVLWFFGFFEPEKRTTTPTLNHYLRHDVSIHFEVYKEDMGEYPTTEEGLKAFYYAPKGKESRWKGPYVPPITSDRWEVTYNTVAQAYTIQIPMIYGR